MSALGLRNLDNVSLQDIHYLLQERPESIGKFIIAGISISSASANVRHAVVFVPRFTDFANSFDQSLVSLTRVQGLLLLFTNPTCLQGFFRLPIPIFVKYHGLVPFHGTDPQELLEALKSARPTIFPFFAIIAWKTV